MNTSMNMNTITPTAAVMSIAKMKAYAAAAKSTVKVKYLKKC